MQFDWIFDPGIKAIALVGICKNAGKTTLLNHLIRLFPQTRFGVFSTGIDGEETDTVFKILKPRVHLAEGNIFCCDTPTLDRHGSQVSILEKTPYNSALRPLWLAQAVLDLETEITGPAALKDQIAILDRMHNHLAEKVLIDGSLDRKSIALSDAVDAVIVALGASFGSISAVATELKRLLLLKDIPVFQPFEKHDYSTLRDARCLMVQDKEDWHSTEIASLLDTEKQLKQLAETKPRRLYIPGVLTDAVHDRILNILRELKAELIFRHPDCLKLNYHKLERFLEEFQPRVLIPFRIKGFVLNSHAVGALPPAPVEFRKQLRRQFPMLDLPDLKEFADE